MSWEEEFDEVWEEGFIKHISMATSIEGFRDMIKSFIRKLLEEERKHNFNNYIFSESDKTKQETKSQCADELENLVNISLKKPNGFVDWVDLKNLIKKWRRNDCRN